MKYIFDENEFFENSVNILRVDTISAFNELRKPREKKVLANIYY